MKEKITNIEKDPLGKEAKTPGAKLDMGKAPVFRGAFQYFPRALKAISEVSQIGAQKYSWKGWESVPGGIERYGDALGRHILAEEIEGEMDLEILENYGVEILHASQQAWNALARLELILKQKEVEG